LSALHPIVVARAEIVHAASAAIPTFLTMEPPLPARFFELRRSSLWGRENTSSLKFIDASRGRASSSAAQVARVAIAWLAKHARIHSAEHTDGGRRTVQPLRRADCEALDRADPLRHFHDRFHLPS